jgi:hypothetical protein
MSKLQIIGDISHGEKYETNGETKWKNTPLGTLFKDNETGEYVVKYLGQWCKVWPPKMKAEGYQQAKQAAQAPVDEMEDEIPF